MSAPTVTLTATVDSHTTRNLHRLLLDGVEVSRRTSATRLYTHVLAIESPVLGWTAWSWHLTAEAARKAARTIRYDRDKRVIEIREVTQ